VRTLALIVLACAADARLHSLSSQTGAQFEGGFSEVKYDGFLSSAAFSLAPTVRWDHPRGRGFIRLRGTYLGFESGRHSLDASLNGSWFTPLGRQWRGELGIAAGASQYADIASFNHGQVDARLHRMGRDRGVWLGGTLGRSSFGGGARPATVVAMGFWMLRGDKTMFASLDRSFVGDTVYTDLRSSARWSTARFVLEGVLGARVWSRGGGRGVFGEGSATLAISSSSAVVMSAGRYPTDVVSGSIAGRYVTVALRLGAIGVRKRAAPVLPGNGHGSGADGSATLGETRLEVEAKQDDDVRLTLFAPGATTVEITGDFTDWQPVPLSRNSGMDDAWGGTFRIPRGVHRINVRRDGGRWVAPGGTLHSVDDYDGEVGVFVLP